MITPEEIKRIVEAERTAQGLPLVCEDLSALAAILAACGLSKATK